MEYIITESQLGRIIKNNSIISEANKSITFDDFVKRASEKHDNKYTYGNAEEDFVNTRSKVQITCPKHGDFSQMVNDHLNGNGCPKCNKKTFDDFVDDASKIHDNKYTYNNAKKDFVNTRSKVSITCPIHGDFPLVVGKHLAGRGCPYCNYKNSFNDIVKDASKIHNNKYTYDNAKKDFVNTKSKVMITCPIHGDFKQSFSNHLAGRGCPRCNESKGEKLISNILEEFLLDYTPENEFKGCIGIKNKRYCLPFDFYVSGKNTLIEFDGEQHFKSIKGKGGDKKFESVKINDQIKNKYAKTNNIKLLRIPYVMKYEEIYKFLEQELLEVNNQIQTKKCSKDKFITPIQYCSMYCNVYENC